MSNLYTFRDIGSRWAIYAPGGRTPWMTLDRNNSTGINDAGKTRVQEIVDALNAKWEVPSLVVTAEAFMLTLHTATPEELQETLKVTDDIMTNFDVSAGLRRVAGKVRTLLRYEVNRS